MNPTNVTLIEKRIAAYDERMGYMAAYADPLATAIAHTQIELAVGLGYELGRANPYKS